MKSPFSALPRAEQPDCDELAATIGQAALKDDGHFYEKSFKFQKKIATRRWLISIAN